MFKKHQYYTTSVFPPSTENSVWGLGKALSKISYISHPQVKISLYNLRIWNGNWGLHRGLSLCKSCKLHVTTLSLWAVEWKLEYHFTYSGTPRCGWRIQTAVPATWRFQEIFRL